MLNVIILLMPLIGQDAGSPPEFQVVEWIARLSVTGLLACGYWLERKERLASQERERSGHDATEKMLERVLPLLNEAAKTLEKNLQVQETLTERAAIGHRPELTDLVEQMNALTDELRSTRRRGG